MEVIDRRYLVYRHIFPNGKSYIGITSRSPEDRWRNGTAYKRQPKISNAIRKYGWSNVRHEILQSGLTLSEANRLEQSLITAFNSVKDGYNITFGGDGLTGVPCSDETKAKISFANKGRTYTHGTKNLLRYQREHGSWNRGSHLSGEHLRKISQERRTRCNKKIQALDPITHNPVFSFESCTIAAQAVGISKENVSRCAHGGRKTAAGYEWRYENESI